MELRKNSTLPTVFEMTDNSMLYYVISTIICVTSVFGVVGNSLISSTILCSRGMRKYSTYNYLIALTISDLFILVGAMLLAVNDIQTFNCQKCNSMSNVSIINRTTHLDASESNRKVRSDNYNFKQPNWDDKPFKNTETSKWLLSWPYLNAIVFTGQMASTWITVAFTADRFIVTAFPLHSYKYCTTQRSILVISIIYFCVAIISIPKYFEYEIRLVPTERLYMQQFTLLSMNDDRKQNFTNILSNFSKMFEYSPFEKKIELSYMGSSSIFRVVYHGYIYLLLIFVVPFLSLLVMNFFIIRSIHKAIKFESSSNMGKSSQNIEVVCIQKNSITKKGYNSIKIKNSVHRFISGSKKKYLSRIMKQRVVNESTLILVIIVLIFFILNLPAMISRFMWAVTDNVTYFKEFSIVLFSEISNFLVVLNSSVNCFDTIDPDDQVQEDSEFKTHIQFLKYNKTKLLEYSFIPKQYLHIDGSLNKHALDDLMFSICMYVYNHPGQSENGIINYFKTTIFPIVVIEMLELLESFKILNSLDMKVTKRNDRLFVNKVEQRIRVWHISDSWIDNYLNFIRILQKV
ncbi:hypothetical protein A3Q56_05183 [Intoshia linei]|uniref:G-protein coupled receptors family 1 profile domain-containing protein n=1 Tax=Intoshia linei TaxID=1819745 RepID=A0A177AYK7_9BILA|nr:hypothetical protein A3Q56_05183 [Intoshia linei]